MRRILTLFLAAMLVLSLAACARQGETQNSVSQPAKSSVQEEAKDIAKDVVQEETLDSEPSILIAYFTRLDNTDATLDEIVQGGGPYGPLGDSIANANVDAIASASITLMDGKAQGNVETMAQMIASVTGGELFSIQTEQGYPIDYDQLIDLGGEEKRQNLRPALATHVEKMENYNIIFLGFPNWWYDMPMALYSFLEEYDFSGKTIIPFASSAGGGFSNTISAICEVQPNTTVVENGLHISMGNVAQGEQRINDWIEQLELLNG